MSGLPALPALDDLSATLHDRARAYLQTNCAHCHQPDGLTPAELDLRFAVRSSDARMCDVVPLLDDLGVADARLVAPFDVSRSVLSLRMHDTGVFRMPPLATEIVHVEGTALIDAWIATSDEDADGVHSACDLCPTESDPSQLDTDLDSWGDACDEDDDGDGLLDAVETGTGVYVSPSDTGTDPLVTDSDGDGFPDGYEVQRGTDPTDPEDVPEVFIVPLLPGGLGLLVGALLLAAAARILRRARRRGD